MKATLIGHACWIFETTGGRILTDPVLSDPFEQGAVTSCPSREVDLDRLPRPDAIVLSHRHLDHYHFETLGLFRRDIPFYCPNDEPMVQGLREMGFTDLRFLEPFEDHDFNGVTITPIPSYSDELLEVGTIFRDDSGTLYNQVDCPLDGKAMQFVRERIGPIDLHLAMYASQAFGFFESKQDNTDEIYANNVFSALALGGTVIVPAAAGFRFADDVGWLNKHLFPISQERFVDDLNRLRPGQRTMCPDPGDTIVIDDREVTLHKQAVDYVRMTVDDRHLLAWDASAPVPPLVDDNATDYPLEFLHGLGEGLIDSFLAYVRGTLDQDPLVHDYAKHGVIYHLEVVYPDVSDDYTFTFAPSGVEVTEAAPTVAPHVTKRIAASALAEVLAGRKSAFWSRTRSRRSAMVISIEANPGGGIGFESVRLPDLLLHFVLAAKASKLGHDKAQREYLGLLPTEAQIAIEPVL